MNGQTPMAPALNFILLEQNETLTKCVKFLVENLRFSKKPVVSEENHQA